MVRWIVFSFLNCSREDVQLLQEIPTLRRAPCVGTLQIPTLQLNNRVYESNEFGQFFSPAIFEGIPTNGFKKWANTRRYFSLGGCECHPSSWSVDEPSEMKPRYG